MIPYAETNGTGTYEAPGVIDCAPVGSLDDTFPPRTRAFVVEYARSSSSIPYLNLSRASHSVSGNGRSGVSQQRVPGFAIVRV